MTATIPLAKGYSPKKLQFPVMVSQKYDGVPIRFDVTKTEVKYVSRQGEHMPSVQHIAEEIRQSLLGTHYFEECTVVAEITHPTLENFKDVSGVVRRKTPNEDLIANVFDFTAPVIGSWPFPERMQLAGTILRTSERLRIVDNTKANCQEELDLLLPQFESPDMEGAIVRQSNSVFKPGTRHWDYQKYVVDPTVDLRITGFEEAVSKDGLPLGMVGRVTAEYKGTEIGIGPGKLSHDDRRKLWALWTKTSPLPWHAHTGTIATIKYKRDPSYEALRQPTFQHWRPEKSVASYD